MLKSASETRKETTPPFKVRFNQGQSQDQGQGQACEDQICAELVRPIGDVVSFQSTRDKTVDRFSSPSRVEDGVYRDAFGSACVKYGTIWQCILWITVQMSLGFDPLKVPFHVFRDSIIMAHVGTSTPAQVFFGLPVRFRFRVRVGVAVLRSTFPTCVPF